MPTEREALEQALKEDEIALDNAKKLIQKVRDAGMEPNPYGLMKDMESFREGVEAKRFQINQINEAIRKLTTAGQP